MTCRSNRAPVELRGRSAPIEQLRRDVRRLATIDAAPVHIRGESGSGKDLVARLIHELSPRSHRPFVVVNCAAIADSLVESELFGHLRGAFTGAQEARKGRFLAADGGTLFLDEIAELSACAQAKILRAVETGQVQQVGSDDTQQVDVRIITATHRDLGQEVARGRFRADLFFRLRVLQVRTPALRDCPEDILSLAAHFLDDCTTRFGLGKRTFTPAAQLALLSHRWPGNVRELKNEVARAAIQATGAWVDLAPAEAMVMAGADHFPAPAGLAERFAALRQTERDLVFAALGRARGNVSEAARLLGISRIMLKRRIDRFGVDTASLRVSNDEPAVAADRSSLPRIDQSS